MPQEEYPSNNKFPQPKPQGPPEEPAKKVDRVVTGNVVRRKKPLGDRIKDKLFNGEGVMSYMVSEVIVPAARETIVDALTGGVERAVFGDERPLGRRSSSRSPLGHTSYDRFSSGSSRRPEPRRELSHRARANHDFEDIIIPTRPEASETVDKMYELTRRYDIATVADLYEMVGISANFTDEKWGWTSETIQGASISRVRDGYRLNLPRPESIRD